MPRPLPKNDYQDLERIYREESTSGSVLGSLQRPSSSSGKRLMMILFFILALGSLAAWSGFYVFNSFSKNQPSELRFEIFAPDAMVVGEPVEYQVRLTNMATTAM